MNSLEYRTFKGWVSVGRRVLLGQKSKLRAPSGEALFERGQTGVPKRYRRPNYTISSWCCDDNYEYDYTLGDSWGGDYY